LKWCILFAIIIFEKILFKNLNPQKVKNRRSKKIKYKEYNINQKLFGENYLIYNWQETSSETHIYVKSKTRTGICPSCNEPSNNYHATYKRSIQMIPMFRKTTYAKVLAYKYNCHNEKCEQKVFMEQLPFVFPSQIRSKELNLLILAVSLFMSNEGASNVLRLIGIKVSDDAIKRLYDSIEIKDEPDIESVGIDDVAIRKGQRYATAIYDINDHHLIALLKERTAETLKEWLKSHKKIKFVTRDRSSAYAQAISDVLPDCIQVADRFHLISNLIEKMRDIFKEEIPDKIFIENNQTLDSPPEKAKKLKVSPDSALLNQYKYDNSIPLNENGTLIHYENKKRNLDSKQYKEYAEKSKKNKR